MSENINLFVYPDSLNAPEYANKRVVFSALKDMRNNGASANETLNQTGSALGDMVDWTVEKLTLGQVNDGHEIDSQVILPYPSALSDNQSHSWQKTDDYQSELTKKTGNLLKNAVLNTKVGGKGSNAETIKNGVNYVMESGSSNMHHAAYAMGKRKPLAAATYFQDYQGSDPRTLTMNYQFLPKNSNEAQTVKNIIMWFKKCSSPWLPTDGCVMMLAPYCFDIDFSGNPYISMMFNVKKCVLTGLQVDYQAGDAFITFGDGFPKMIAMTLAFTETTLTYANDYERAEELLKDAKGPVNLAMTKHHTSLYEDMSSFLTGDEKPKNR